MEGANGYLQGFVGCVDFDAAKLGEVRGEFASFKKIFVGWGELISDYTEFLELVVKMSFLENIKRVQL